MNAAGRGLLLVWTDVDDAVEARFNAWYDRDHARERVERVPGMLRVRRFVAEQGGPKYLAAYDMQDKNVMLSEPYLALRRSRDPESRVLIPAFRNTLKLVGSVVADEERAEGAFCALLRPPDDEILPDATPQNLRAIVASVMAIEGVVAARVAKSEEALLSLTRQFTTRSADRFLDWIVMIETTETGAMQSAIGRLKGPTAPAWLADSLVTQLRFRYARHADARSVEPYSGPTQ